MRLAGAFDIGRWLALRDDFPTESGATRDEWVEVVVEAMRAEHGADAIDPMAPLVRAAIQHGIDLVEPTAIATLQHWPTPLPANAVVTIEGVLAGPEETASLALVPDGLDPSTTRVALIETEGLGVGCEVRYPVPSGSTAEADLVGVTIAFRSAVGAVRLSASAVPPALAPMLIQDLRGLAACIHPVADASEPAWQPGSLDLVLMRPTASEAWALDGAA